MDSTTLAALISAVATVIAAIIATRGRRDHPKKEDERSSSKSAVLTEEAGVVVRQPETLPHEIIENSIGMRLVLVRPGNFLLSPASEGGCINDEGPQHKVEITRPFYLGVFQVTQEQYPKVMGSNPSHFTSERGGGPNHPVECVSWQEANAFCRKLTEKTEEQRAGRRYRLPTEAEWEYACRAGSEGVYCFGDDPNQLGDYAWHRDNSCRTTQVVGSTQKPNAWSLYDMHGNVWEWCADWFDDKHDRRVLRGGSWYDSGYDCRSARRNREAPGKSWKTIGFRLVCEAPRTS